MRRIWIIILVALFLLNGCAYFNTFYNAKKYFNQAEAGRRSPTDKPSTQQLSNYDKAIEKCGLLVQRYKKSKYRDDALFLMGKAFLAKGTPDDLNKAISTLEQLIDNYPSSPFVDEAGVLIGQVYASQNRTDEAIKILQGVITKYPDRDFAVTAQYQLGDLYLKNEKFDDALAAYQNVLKLRQTSKIIRAEAWVKTGDLYAKQTDHSQAETAYAQAIGLTDDAGRRLEIEYKRGESLVALERYKEAERLFAQLSRIQERKTQDRARIRLGDALVAQGDTLAGWKLWEEITTKQGGEATAVAEAYVQMGRLLQNQADYDSARFCFEQASRRASGSEIGLLATQKKNETDQLIKLRKGSDSPDENARNRFLLGELYLNDLKRTDFARGYFQLVADSFPASPFAAKALYALGYIAETQDKDLAAADRFYDQILDQYPSSEAANGVRKKFGMAEVATLYQLPPPPDTTKKAAPRPPADSTAATIKPTSTDSVIAAPIQPAKRDSIVAGRPNALPLPDSLAAKGDSLDPKGFLKPLGSPSSGDSLKSALPAMPARPDSVRPDTTRPPRRRGLIEE